jgi:hypothetical protein
MEEALYARLQATKTATGFFNCFSTFLENIRLGKHLLDKRFPIFLLLVATNFIVSRGSIHLLEREP